MPWPQEPIAGEDAFVWQGKQVAYFSKRPQLPPTGGLLAICEHTVLCGMHVPDGQVMSAAAELAVQDA